MRAVPLALVAAVACRRAPPPAAPDAPAAPSAPRAHDLTRAYQVVEVRDGATIRGHVRWRGPRPRPEAMVVPPHSDPGHCGTQQPLEPLTVAPDGGVLGAVVSLRIMR